MRDFKHFTKSNWIKAILLAFFHPFFQVNEVCDDPTCARDKAKDWATKIKGNSHWPQSCSQSLLGTYLNCKWETYWPKLYALLQLRFQPQGDIGPSLRRWKCIPRRIMRKGPKTASHPAMAESILWSEPIFLLFDNYLSPTDAYPLFVQGGPDLFAA
jgi:hypothetical protein